MTQPYISYLIEWAARAQPAGERTWRRSWFGTHTTDPANELDMRQQLHLLRTRPEYAGLVYRLVRIKTTTTIIDTGEVDGVVAGGGG